jgi:hypothetical protein
MWSYVNALADYWHLAYKSKVKSSVSVNIEKDKQITIIIRH